MRREGLYSSHIIDWRRARDAAASPGREPARGRPRSDPRDAQIARLTREKEHLEQERGPAWKVAAGCARMPVIVVAVVIRRQLAGLTQATIGPQLDAFRTIECCPMSAERPGPGRLTLP